MNGIKMSNKSLVSLTTWVKQTYNDAAPCLNTLRKWAHKALIQPRHSAMAERTLLIPMLGQ